MVERLRRAHAALLNREKGLSNCVAAQLTASRTAADPDRTAIDRVRNSDRQYV